MFFKKWLRSSLTLKHMITLIAAIVFVVAAMFLFSGKIASMNNYSKFLDSRNYAYSVNIDKDIGENTYAFYKNKITFYSDMNLLEYVNSDVLMELNDTYTSDDFLYGYEIHRLEKYEIAISLNLAKFHQLEEGSLVFSKNKVTNKIESYTIKFILPDIYGVSGKNIENGKGLIVIGLDSDYLSNIKCEYVYFYKDNYTLINKHNANILGELTSIRNTKINVLKRYIFFIGIDNMIIMLVSLLCFFLLSEFNKSVYLKRKEYGNSNLYKMIFIDYSIYLILLVLLTETLYLLSFFLNNYAIEVAVHTCFALIFSAFVISIKYKKIIMRGS